MTPRRCKGFVLLRLRQSSPFNEQNTFLEEWEFRPAANRSQYSAFAQAIALAVETALENVNAEQHFPKTVHALECRSICR